MFILQNINNRCINSVFQKSNMHFLSLLHVKVEYLSVILKFYNFCQIIIHKHVWWFTCFVLSKHFNVESWKDYSNIIILFS